MKNFILITIALLFSIILTAQTTLINYNSSWKYLDNGSNQGTAWRNVSFNDASWATGTAAFGYGTSGITTTVSYGSNNKKKDITTYFRKTISIADASLYSSFTLNLKRDDGAVVYINGTERFRSNMPTGTISYTTKASSEATDNGTAIQTTTLSAGSLVTGTNVIAVEIHQAANNGPDLFFDLQLNGTADVTPPAVTTFSPTDNSTNVSNSANLVLTFNENIQKGAGNILVKEGGVTTQTIDVTSAAVTVSGNTATINPADFNFGAAVNIEIAAGAFKDLFNNNYAGIANSTTWNFSVIAPDLTPPTVTTYSPTDNATLISRTANLVLTFSENIQKGVGNILVKEGGVTTQTIDVTSAAITVSGNTAIINPADFTYSATVTIEIAAGTFKDLSNNNYAGIADATTWNFTVQDAPPSGPQTLVAYGSSWKYLDNGTNQGTAWRGTSFNDVAWASGNAQLGYGDGDEATVVSYGTDANNKYITTYFRKTISIANPSSFTSILGNVKRDDGIAIYVNGTEVYRNNLAAGAAYNTLATLASDDGATAQAFSFSPSAFVSGNNVIAVEIHQNALTSTDISFDLELIGTDATTLTRGPYMNMALQNSIVIRWKTDVATNSKVNYGTTAGNLIQSFTDNTNTTEHIVTLTGLVENTLYYYSIGSTTQTLQGDANNYFKTMPVVGSTEKIRVLAMGDMGDNSANQLSVRNAYLNFNGSNYTNAWLLLGDNAYENGLDAEYQSNFFNIYQGSLTKNHVLWPSPGNHDYANSSARQADHNIAYYNIFSLPSNGQAGGVASNTEAFYSYNYGNIHFVALDSYGWETGNTRLYDTLGPQMVWLKQDLTANTQPWTIIYFHHPPYTKTSHNSDTETELINMRQRVVRIFERYKVDMVLNGHSHGYERSFLLNGHYDVESTFNPATHALSTSSAKYNGTANSCIYIKNSTDARNGIVYVVAGSAGQLDGTSAGYPHNAMYYSDVSIGGAFFFEVEGNRLDAKWVCSDGVIRDQFTMMKDVNKTTNLTIPSGTPTQLTASWNGNYNWSTSETTRSINVSPTSNTTYTVTDGVNCITDVFNISVTGGLINRFTKSTPETNTNEGFKIIPTLVHRGQPLVVRSGSSISIELSLIDVNGRLIRNLKVTQATSIRTDNLQPGTYFIRLKGKAKPIVQKIIVLD
ncbi:MAG: Ig-like domain-containing protein [Bacteroidota bacterium]